MRKRWLTIIPKCGGECLGYWMPHEGTNNIALRADFRSRVSPPTRAIAPGCGRQAEGMANFNFAEENKFILAEERTFLRKVT